MLEDKYRIKKIVVAVDGSDHAAAVVQWAQIARGMKAEVVAGTPSIRRPTSSRATEPSSLLASNRSGVLR